MSTLNLGDSLILDSDYSESEVKTGATWIDGKPIYQKTFVSSTISPTITNNRIMFGFASGSIPNLENFVKAFGLATMNGGVYPNRKYMLPCTLCNTDMSVQVAGGFQLDGTSITSYFFVNKAFNSSITSVNIVFTVLYTKTTD